MTLHTQNASSASGDVNGYPLIEPIQVSSPEILLAQGILGAIVHDNTLLSIVDGLLEPEFFQHPILCRAYSLARESIRAGETVDALRLGAKFGHCEAFPGMPMGKFLGILIANRPVTVSLKGYAEELRRFAKEAVVDAALAEHGLLPDRTTRDLVALVDKLRGIEEHFSQRQDGSDLEFSSDVSLEALNPYLVKGVLPPASNALLYGASGGGKTFFAIHLAGCIARGQPFLGGEPTPALHFTWRSRVSIISAFALRHGSGSTVN